MKNIKSILGAIEHNKEDLMLSMHRADVLIDESMPFYGDLYIVSLGFHMQAGYSIRRWSKQST